MSTLIFNPSRNKQTGKYAEIYRYLYTCCAEMNTNCTTDSQTVYLALHFMSGGITAPLPPLAPSECCRYLLLLYTHTLLVINHRLVSYTTNNIHTFKYFEVFMILYSTLVQYVYL